MTRCFAYIVAAAVFLPVQSTLLPLMLAPQWRPNVILILVLLLGVREKPLPAMMAVLLIGALQDSMGGSTIGLHISACLAVFILTRLTAERLNVESPPLLVLMLIGANFTYGLLVAFIMTTFTDLGTILSLLVSTLPQQTLSTLFVFFVLMILFPGWVLKGTGRSDNDDRLFRGELS